MPETKKSRMEGIIESILRRASYDKAFRTLALTDVDGLFQKYGVKLPKNHGIRFIESPERGQKKAIVLPPPITVKLKDEDLVVVVGDKEIQLARYENLGGAKIEKLFGRVSYENWGSE